MIDTELNLRIVLFITLKDLTIQKEAFDLCYPAAAEGDPRIAALLRVVRSPGYRRLLGELPGYHTAGAGAVRGVS